MDTERKVLVRGTSEMNTERKVLVRGTGKEEREEALEEREEAGMKIEVANVGW